MTSEIFYKFKSQREESRIAFDGTGISVFDLKKEIILAKDLGKANDFDLAIFDNGTEQEYRDDSYIIPRSSSVIVKRLPAARPGKGRAAYYIASVTDASGKDRQHASSGAPGGTWKAGGTMSKRFDGKDDSKYRQPMLPTGPTALAPIKSAAVQDDEAASLAAMFQATTEAWEETQEKMSQAQKIYTNPRGGAAGPRKPFTSGHSNFHQQHTPSDRPTPPGYICYRCGQKGHWIQECPTNNDREYDNKPRIKRTTGIPRSFLKAVEQPTDGTALQGVMVTPDGGYVIAQPDSAAWQKQRARPKIVTESDVREKPPADPTLACPMCSKLFREAVNTPCCNTTYCEDCIQTHLLERDFTCPGCNAKIGSLVKLVPNKEVRYLTRAYIDKAIEESKAVSEEATSDIKPPGELNGADDSAEANNENEFYEQQPGGNLIDPSMPDPASLVPNIPQLQAELAQLTKMLNSNIPAQARAQIQMQASQLSQQIQQAQMMIQLANSMTNPSVTSTNMMMPTGQGQYLGGGGMMVNQGPDGYNARGYKKGEYRPGWTNPFPNQQPAGVESAYQRLPVNPRRRGQKRERPSDFLEMGEREQKMPRYWE